MGNPTKQSSTSSIAKGGCDDGNKKRKEPPDADDAKPPAKKPSIRKTIDKHFFSTPAMLNNNIKQIKTEAPSKEVVSIKRCFEQALIHKHAADEADAAKEWEAAQRHIDNYHACHKQAEADVTLYENCKWAVGYATNMIESYRKKKEYLKCKEMEELRIIAQAFLDLVGCDDIDFINKRNEAAAQKKPSPTRATTSTASRPTTTTTTVAAAPIATAATMVGAATTEAITVDSDSEEDDEGDDAGTDSVDTQNEEGIEFAEAAKAAGSRQQKSRTYKSKDGTTPTPKKKTPPPSVDKFHDFMKMTYAKATIVEGKVTLCVEINPSTEPYIMDRGLLYCLCCLKEVDWLNRKKHAARSKHKIAKALAEKNKKQTKEQRKKAQSRIREEGLVGGTASDEKLDAALNYLKYSFGANCSLNSVEENKGALMQISNVAVPGEREMSDRIPDLRAWHLDKIKEHLKKAFPEFAVILDASPLFAEIECVMIRFVDRDFNIHEFVVHLEMYAESLNGENVAKHMEKTFEKLDLQMKNWRATMLDRAGTNKNATNRMKEKYKVNPLDVWCTSHGTSGCGKKADYPIGKKILRAFSRVVKFGLCKARNVFRSCFGESAKKLSGVRWGIEHEMAEQVNRISIDTMLGDYIAICEERSYSAKSVSKLLSLAEDNHDVCVASCQIAAVVDAGEPLVQSTYTNESKQPNVLVVHENFAALKELYARGKHFYDFSRLDKECVVAVEQMKDVMAPMQQGIDDAKVLLDEAKAAEAAAKAAVDAARNEAAAPASNRQRRSNNPRHNYAQMANPNAQNVPNAVDDALDAAYTAAKEEAAAMKDTYDEKVEAFAEFKSNHCTTYDDFFDEGLQAVAPIFKDVKRLFFSPTGDYYELVGAYTAAAVFDVTVVGGMNQAQIVDRIKDLKKFGFDEFRDGNGIIDDMIKELPAYLAVVNATPEEFWDTVDGAAEFNEDLKKKQESEDPDIMAKFAGKTWRDDRIEKARRIWEWWKTYHHKFTYFSNAVRLVVLVQTSSASVERVFSQIKIIVDNIGECALESTLETRLMSRVNDYGD